MAPLLLSLLAAATLVSAFPPFSLGFMAWVGVALFLLAIRRARSYGHAALIGGLFGFAYFGGVMWWIGRLGFIAWLPLMVVLALFSAAFAALLHRFRRRPDWEWLLASVVIWGLIEWLRVRIPFGGLPWASVGLPMGEYAWTRSASQWIGAAGWSLVVVLVGGSAALAFDRQRARYLAGPVSVVVLLAIAGAVWFPVAGGPELRVAIVQGENPCPATHCAGERQAVYDSHLALTRELEPGTVDLVVWGESSTGFTTGPIENPEVAAEIGVEARRLDAYFLIGGDRPAGEDHFLNVNVLIDPSGQIVGEYRKNRPVPFGEYIPFRPLFEWIPELSQVPRDMIRGDGPVVFQLPQGGIGSVISFEAAFHRYFRDHVLEGAQLMVVATNQSSYGIAPASDQLIGITRMRAAELGQDLVHSAVTGRSTFITASGETGYRTGLYTGEVIEETVRFRTADPTFFVRWGVWLPVVLLAAVAGLEFLRSRQE